jgi:multiple antibiotic resistance protein
MSLGPFPTSTAIGAFLLAFPALFSIVNPLGSALIFCDLTADRSHAERVALSRAIAFNASLVLIGSLWFGAGILNFFGVSLGAVRVGGGIVVAITAWRVLMPAGVSATSPDPSTQTPDGTSTFFPLTMPITTGPGSIAVAIALASEKPFGGPGSFPFFAGLTMAAIANAVLVFFLYTSADWVLLRLGNGGARVVTRLSAFLLLCIGVQIASTGAEDLWASWPSHPVQATGAQHGPLAPNGSSGAISPPPPRQPA